VNEESEALFKGVKGDKGAKGDRGERGMPAGQRRAIVYLFVLPVVFIAVGFFWLARIQYDNDHERCGSITQIVAIPIPVPTQGNPSREAWARFEQVERQRGTQLHCPMGAPRYAKSKSGS
jgi:hypothetical protein